MKRADQDAHPVLPVRALTSQVLDRLRWRASDPYTMSVVVACALVASGFAAINVAWRGAAATALVPVQIAFVVSGGAGGLALIGAGIALLHVQNCRRIAAQERAEMTEVLRQATRVRELTESARLGP
ncbi:MAG: hypothetical protein LC808_42925 [Actinobacteria bacterium]|nr:hypothetical protein [Actinomycetota bacterium]